MFGNTQCLLSVVLVILNNRGIAKQSQDDVKTKENFDLNTTHIIIQSILLCGPDVVCDKSILSSLGIRIDSDVVPPNRCPYCTCQEYDCYSKWSNHPCCPDLFFQKSLLECTDTYVAPFRFSKPDLMVSRCPVGTGAILSGNCTKEHEEKDLLTLPPVASSTSWISYKNKYCALCHNETNYLEWVLSFKCLVPTDINHRSSSDDLIAFAKSESCGIHFEHPDIGPHMKLCPTRYNKIIGACNVSGTWLHYDDQIQTACQSGYEARYGIFKNIFCKICNPPKFEERVLITACEHSSIFEDACLNLTFLQASFPYKNYFCFVCNHGDNNEEYYNDVRFIAANETYWGNEFKFDIEIAYIADHVKVYLQENVEKIESNVLNINTEAIKPSEEPMQTNFQRTVEMFELPIDNTICSMRSSNGTSPDTPPDNLSLFRYSINLTNLVYAGFSLSGTGTCTPGLLPNYTLSLRRDCSCSAGCVFGCCDDFSIRQKWTCISDVYPGSEGNDAYKNFRAINGCLRTNYLGKLCTQKNVSHFYHSTPVQHTYWSFQQVIDSFKESSCDIRFHVPFFTERCSDVCDVEISSCNLSGTWKSYNKDVQIACEQADALTFPPVSSGLVAYKNKFCLICNPTEVNSSEIIQTCKQDKDPNLVKACLQFQSIHVCSQYKNIFCEMCNDMNVSCEGIVYWNYTTGEVHGSTFPYDFSFRLPFSLAAYDKNDDKTLLESPLSCLPNQIYDERLKSCKDLICFPGKTLWNGTCVSVLAASTNLRYTLATKVKFTLLTGNTGTVQGTLFKFKALLWEKIHQLTQRTETHYTAIENFILMVSTGCRTLNVRQGEIYSYVKFVITKQINRDELEERLVLFMETASNWTLSNTTIAEVAMSVSERAFMLPYLSMRFNRKRQCFIFQDRLDCQSSAYRNNLISPLLTCPQIQIKENDFGSALVDIQTDYTFSGFSIYQSRAANIGFRICARDLSEIKLKGLKESRFLSTLTLICICVSLVALLLTFLTYCLFPSIRTLPGINNMILVLFLFLAQTCLIVRPLSYTSGLEVVSALSHFSWLLVFFWLQICSFHMFRVFTAKQRWDNSPTSIKKTVTKYFLYAFGSATIIVTSNIVTSLILSNGQNTGYDKALTLMTHRTAFIITLLVPLIFVCLTNIFFYILTAYKICSSPDIESTTGNRVQFSVYIKLFTLTGLSWMLQIIDAFIDVSVFSYVVAILNGLQGLLIFLSCVCNDRVWNLYKIALGQNRYFHPRQSTTHSQSHSSSK
ncbi:uncharacterized protein LOC134250022 [Saccostrea cucullata]|uniref:uncharacterized protein LOC134250022 n=1 Tax=Saccostrea cuccullata TaxID=36930 RepID=UPI002ED2B7F9